jgi:hypothetical protein
MIRNPERYSFLFHAQGYLKVARLHCQQLLNPVHKWSEGNPRVPPEWPNPMDYHPVEVLPATMFIIHHAIELFLKSFLIDIGKPNKSSHDLKVLFAPIDQAIIDTNWLPITINNDQEILDQEEIDRIQKIVIPELRDLIGYVADRAVLQQKLDDPGNELFRYPKTRKGQEYDMNVLGNVDIGDLLKKIDRLYEHLNDIGYLFAVDERHKPRG